MLNYDNAENRKMTEHCIRTGKVLINPIIDWEESDVWEFLNSNGIEHCCLYDEGMKRLGCIGCPLGRAESIKREFARWPAYRKLYMRAFEKMLEEREKRGLKNMGWDTPEDVMKWWLQEEDKE